MTFINDTTDVITSIQIGNVSATEGPSSVSVSSSSTPTTTILDFNIPPGASGSDATISSVTASSVPSTDNADVTLGGTPSARTFEFSRLHYSWNIYDL